MERGPQLRRYKRAYEALTWVLEHVEDPVVRDIVADSKLRLYAPRSARARRMSPYERYIKALKRAIAQNPAFLSDGPQPSGRVHRCL